MATTIKFTKMQGAGNDYIYVNTLRHPIADPVRTSIKWSSCHTGIGSDGLVLIGKSTKADFSMRIFNADGSEAMMCGNASRCIGKYVYDNKLTQKEVITLETLSGIKILKLHTENGLVEEVTVDMDLPLLTNSRQINTPDGKMLAKTITVDGKEYKGTFVCMGNPHLVIFIDDIKNVLAQLPPEHVEGLTHIWLRKTNKKEKYQGVYTVGSGVRLITLYPFPKSNQLILGKERPTHKLLTWYKGYASEPQKEKDNWYIDSSICGWDYHAVV